MTPNNKLDREALPAPETSFRTEPVPPFIPPRDKLERQLWEQELGVQSVGIRHDFFDLGGHSLLAVRLFSRIEGEVGIKLPVMALFRAPTVERLARLIRSEEWPVEVPSLVPIQPNSDKPPIFWVHAAGGHLLLYRKLAEHLGQNQPSYALQAPEVEPRSRQRLSVPEMAAAYPREVRSVQVEGPYYLGGLSFGGLVAWEMAQQLYDRGQRVATLVLLDTRYPGYPKTIWPNWMLFDVRQRLGFHFGNLSARDTRGKIEYVNERLRVFLVRSRIRGLGTTRAKQSDDFDRPDAARGSYVAAEIARANYTPTTYPGGVLLIRAATQPKGADDPLLGWGGKALGGLEVRDVPGTHVSIIAEPHLRNVADKISRYLDRVRQDEAGEDLK